MAANKTDIAKLKRELGNSPLPQGFDPDLLDAVREYMSSDRLPSTDRKLFNQVPLDDRYRMFPQKAREAWRLASPRAQMVFLELWHQHEDRNAAQNGFIHSSISFLCTWTGIGKRNSVQDAIDELECRGLIRVHRGRGGSGGIKLSNCFQLTCFPDARGKPATQDYLELGLPKEKPTANHPATRLTEYQQIKARLHAHIKKKMLLMKELRKQAGAM